MLFSFFFVLVLVNKGNVFVWGCDLILSCWGFLEVMKGLYAKKHAKMKKSQQESDPNEKAGQRSEPDKQNKVNFLKDTYIISYL